MVYLTKYSTRSNVDVGTCPSCLKRRNSFTRGILNAKRADILLRCLWMKDYMYFKYRVLHRVSICEFIEKGRGTYHYLFSVSLNLKCECTLSPSRSISRVERKLKCPYEKI